MPRKASIDAPGAVHHIIIRGIRRRRIVTDDQDRDDFVERLGEMVSETRSFVLPGVGAQSCPYFVANRPSARIHGHALFAGRLCGLV
jgi:hypothetical protein